MLKVSSGLLRGVPLRAPTGPQTRPSSERLRQGIFNVLRHYRWSAQQPILEGAVVADLFAGTGALGIEALSNGATGAWFIETHPATLKTLEQNLETARRCFESQRLAVPELNVVRRDAIVALSRLPELRVLFCDPPYEKGWFEKVVAAEEAAHRLVVGGLLIYEARDREAVPDVTGKLKHFDTKIYGDSSVHFFVKMAESCARPSTPAASTL